MLYNKEHFKSLIGGATAEGQSKADGNRYAIFTMVSYIPKIEDKYDFLKKYNKSLWKIDESLTNNDITTLYKGNECIVSIRGTVWSDAQDVIADAGILIGMNAFTPKAVSVKNQIRSVIQKYGKQFALTI